VTVGKGVDNYIVYHRTETRMEWARQGRQYRMIKIVSLMTCLPTFLSSWLKETRMLDIGRSSGMRKVLKPRHHRFAEVCPINHEFMIEMGASPLTHDGNCSRSIKAHVYTGMLSRIGKDLSGTGKIEDVCSSRLGEHVSEPGKIKDICYSL
jgi:hypothetical protein